jgi:hypothetical protein
MVSHTYAVANPRAVMVHLHNTLLTNAAVMTPWRFYNLALFAEPELFEHITPDGVTCISKRMAASSNSDFGKKWLMNSFFQVNLVCPITLRLVNTIANY